MKTGEVTEQSGFVTEGPISSTKMEVLASYQALRAMREMPVREESKVLLRSDLKKLVKWMEDGFPDLEVGPEGEERDYADREQMDTARAEFQTLEGLGVEVAVQHIRKSSRDPDHVRADELTKEAYLAWRRAEEARRPKSSGSEETAPSAPGDQQDEG